MGSLNQIDGLKLGDYRLRLADVSRGRFAGEYNFRLFLECPEGGRSLEPVVEGKYFEGRGRWYRPWLEFRFNEVLSVDSGQLLLSDGGLDESLFRVLSRLIPPGGHMMVKYLDHPITARGLNKGVPPATTPIGYLLFQAGFRWYKDWYFPEGWLEGEMKLQADKPFDEEHRRRNTREIVEALKEYLRSGGESPYREYAMRIVELSGESS